jgi:hypothetical protein
MELELLKDLDTIFTSAVAPEKITRSDGRGGVGVLGYLLEKACF